jgi:hypothetical protein
MTTSIKKSGKPTGEMLVGFASEVSIFFGFLLFISSLVLVIAGSFIIFKLLKLRNTSRR